MQPGRRLLPRRPVGWTAGRVIAVVTGSILALVSVGLLTGGGTLLWADQTQRQGGYLTSGTATFATSGHALASDTVNLHGGWDWFGIFVGQLRIRATAADPAGLRRGRVGRGRYQVPRPTTSHPGTCAGAGSPATPPYPRPPRDRRRASSGRFLQPPAGQHDADHRRGGQFAYRDRADDREQRDDVDPALPLSSWRSSAAARPPGEGRRTSSRPTCDSGRVCRAVWTIKIVAAVRRPDPEPWLVRHAAAALLALSTSGVVAGGAAHLAGPQAPGTPRGWLPGRAERRMRCGRWHRLSAAAARPRARPVGVAESRPGIHRCCRVRDGRHRMGGPCAPSSRPSPRAQVAPGAAGRRQLRRPDRLRPLGPGPPGTSHPTGSPGR